jgi:hypothetical protein
MKQPDRQSDWDCRMTRLEWLLIAVILALIAWIAMPHASRGQTGTSDLVLVGDLAQLRNAIDLYAADHGGRFPDPQWIVGQLTGRTDVGGRVVARSGHQPVLGPYMDSIPPLSIGNRRGGTHIVDGTRHAPGAEAGGWWYHPRGGMIKPNAQPTETDVRGRALLSY